MTNHAEAAANDRFHAGRDDAEYSRVVTAGIKRRLKRDPDYWNGYHTGRPAALERHNTTIIEDPTRPAGWCCRPLS